MLSLSSKPRTGEQCCLRVVSSGLLFSSLNWNHVGNPQGFSEVAIFDLHLETLKISYRQMWEGHSRKREQPVRSCTKAAGLICRQQVVGWTEHWCSCSPTWDSPRNELPALMIIFNETSQLDTLLLFCSGDYGLGDRWGERANSNWCSVWI
jgi:hypothetical protein